MNTLTAERDLAAARDAASIGSPQATKGVRQALLRGVIMVTHRANRMNATIMNLHKENHACLGVSDLSLPTIRSAVSSPLDSFMSTPHETCVRTQYPFAGIISARSIVQWLQCSDNFFRFVVVSISWAQGINILL